jgi:hypothetical protein
MANSGDIGALSTRLNVLLLVAGAVLMLTGADLIPVDPSRFHTPHWVVLVAGLAFSSVGCISFLAHHRDTHPARYLFMVSILMTCLFLVTAAVARYGSGFAIAVGPIFIRGGTGDHIARFMCGTAAVILGILALGVWRRWLRALTSPNHSSQSDAPPSGGAPLS